MCIRDSRNTSQWEKIENGLSNNVNDLTYRNGYLYVAGSFEAALNNAPTQNIIVNGLVRWSAGSGWEALGTNTNVGVDNLLNAMAFAGNELYVGGIFEMAGQDNISNFTCWQEACAGVDLDINFDSSPIQTSWEITDDNGNVVASSGGNVYGANLANSNLDLQDVSCLPDGCYNLIFYDSVNNGMCPFRAVASSSGLFITPGTLISSGATVATLGTVVTPGLCGNYTLTDAAGNVLASGGGSFGGQESSNFCLSGGIAPFVQPDNDSYFNQNSKVNDLQIRPNIVSNEMTVICRLEQTAAAQLYIIDINGKILQQHTYNMNDTPQIELNVSELASGFYFLKLLSGNRMMTKKFVKH